MGGKDASAARHIFTCFTPLTPMLFMRQDEGLLDYMDDDGYPVEPEYYVPILPMVLVNGVTGIGTGFSSDVPSYNPEDLVGVVRACLDAVDPSTVDMSTAGREVRVAPDGNVGINVQDPSPRSPSGASFLSQHLYPSS